MKFKLLILLLLMTLIRVQAQTEGNWQQSVKLPQFYLGMQTGVESFTGLFGVTADFRVSNNFFVHAGAGIGSWGSKLSVGIRNEKKYESSIGYGIYLSRASGLKNFTTELETTAGTKNVNMDLLSGMTINPEVSYKWVMKKGNRFFIEVGYAVPLQSNPWKILDGSVLTTTSTQVMKILSPGGFSAGMGFQFAL
ncbi:MAG: hypothetical protein IPH88_00500 [Bacteroidales bacterium]|nr:hypothetical protein [Bacteroidales bacterium]